MPIGHRVATLSLSALAVCWLTWTVPLAAAGEAPRHASSATAVVRGLDLKLFGSPVTFDSSSAGIDALTAKADGAGVDRAAGAAVSVQVENVNTRERDDECVPDLALLEILTVHMACSEARVQHLPPQYTADFPRHTGAAFFGAPPDDADPPAAAVENGGPQAVGRASVEGVEIMGAELLQSTIDLLQALLEVLIPVPDQSIGAVAQSIGPELGKVLEPMAANLGLLPTDPVSPVSALVKQLLDGTREATGLMSARLTGSTATANTSPEKVVALAEAGAGQVDILPGVAPGGAPLLSVIVGGSRSISTLDRATSVPTSALEPTEVRVRLGFPLTGGDTTELVVPAESPITLLAGTPLETTVALGERRNVSAADGSVSSSVGGATARTLKGMRGGIDLQLGHAESLIRPGVIPKAGGSGRGPMILAAGLVLGVGLALLAYIIRRRRRPVVSSNA